jgi:hypothetical protein
MAKILQCIICKSEFLAAGRGHTCRKVCYNPDCANEHRRTYMEEYRKLGRPKKPQQVVEQKGMMREAFVPVNLQRLTPEQIVRVFSKVITGSER